MTGTVSDCLYPGRKELPKSRALPEADTVRNRPKEVTTLKGDYERAMLG